MSVSADIGNGCVMMEWKKANTNWRAGQTKGSCFQMKNVNFRRAGGLHRRQKGGPAGCTKGRPGELQKRAAFQPALF